MLRNSIQKAKKRRQLTGASPLFVLDASHCSHHLFFRFFSGLVFTMSMGMDSRCEAHVSFWRAVVFNPGLPITALFHHETTQWNFGIASSAATGWFWVPNACLIVFRFVFSGAGLRLPKGATFPQKKLFQGPQRWALVDCLPEPWWDENRCDMMWN